MKIWASHITFLEYLKGFFAFSKIIDVDKNLSLKRKIVSFIKAQHSKSDISDIYLALFLAKPLPYSLQQHFSNLGISHLIAISGFHLGVLSAILFFLIKYPYKYLQNNYFPYRSYQRDSFYIIAIFLCFYMLFLDSPPSLLRSYMLLVVGFFLYDQGLKVISMQTLFITFILLISLFVQLLFSIGFFLSIAGVFYIFLFLIHFQNKSKLLQFILIPLWIYLLMLPYSLALFGNFSLYHPLSIVWTSLFTLFYPLAIFLHLIGEGNLLDHTVTLLLKLDPKALHLHLSSYFIFVEILLSLGAIFNKKALYLLLLYVISIFIYAIYHVT
jgi:competence protein ComEC